MAWAKLLSEPRDTDASQESSNLSTAVSKWRTMAPKCLGEKLKMTHNSSCWQCCEQLKNSLSSWERTDVSRGGRGGFSVKPVRGSVCGTCRNKTGFFTDTNGDRYQDIEKDRSEAHCMGSIVNTRTWARPLIFQAQSFKALLLHKPPGMQTTSVQSLKGKIPSLCLLGIDMIAFSIIRGWKYKEKKTI